MTSLHRLHTFGRIFAPRAGGLYRQWLLAFALLLAWTQAASAQTAPGPTTINCPYATTNPNTCWVTGDFTATVTPASGGSGTTVTNYDLCRSEDKDHDGFSGCEQTISLDAGTSYTVSGSHLPGDGQRRSYRFRAYFSNGQPGPWNVPRYVRIDRYDPVVAATGAFQVTQPSVQATITAHDATGNAVSNSGIDTVRYSWNTPTNAGCTNGTVTSHGAVLNAPEGDNTLYLCARDNTGRIDTWDGLYRVDSTPGSPPGPTTIACPYTTTNPDTCWVAGDFTATVTPADPFFGGHPLSGYEICRSEDKNHDNWSGCEAGIAYPVGTSYTVTGSDLPGDGMRRSYRFRPYYANVATEFWNTPRYVRIDRHDPTVSATGWSGDWQTSAQATISAADNVAGAHINTGLQQVRYSWNNPINQACSGGSLTSHGAVLNAPEGDNTLYLCARDKVGRVKHWNGPFRVDSSSPTPPGPTTVPCAHAMTNPNTCWVTGDFVASVTPAGDGAGGSSIASYDFCRSQDKDHDLFSGCEQNITTNAGTSHTISGSHLPGDGKRRSYWVRAVYNDGTYGDWNTPRFVRIDRYDPRVSATNASPQWFTSRSLTLAADDAGGPGAAVNTGLVEARYRWNVPTNGACTNGTVYTHGQTLNVPEGDNTLYLCGRDVTGRVGTWNNTYRVDSSIPVLDSLTISNNVWSVGDNTTYQITAKTTDTGAGVRELWVTINRDGDNSANPRGQFSWRDASMGYLWPTDQVPCQGGGFASKRPDLFGPEHTTLVGCVTSVTAGGQRTVTFTVRPETSFGAHTANDISLFSRDFLANRTPWVNYNLNFASVVLGSPVLMVLDGNNALAQHEDVPWGTVQGGSGDIPRELVVRNAAPTGSSPLVLERGPGLSNIAIAGSSAFSLSGTLDPLLQPGEEDTFSVVLDTSQSGTHSAFLYIWHNHGNRPNPLTIDLTATVESNSPPVIDSVSPWKITPGGVRTVTLSGQNFDGATLMIPTAPFDGDQPPRVFPTVTSYSVNPAGTQITAQINTSAAGIDGIYNLLVQTPCQDCVDAIDLRVAPANTPVVDMYTPSEVGVGRIYPVVMTGANLQGSTMTATHSGVQILDVDNSDDEMISGALSIPVGVNPGDFDIEIFTPGQGLTTVPVAFLLEGEPATKTNHAVISEEKVAAAQAAGTEMPGIYVQEPTLSPAMQARIAAGDISAEKVTSCIFGFNRRLFSFTRILIIPLDGLGNINHQVLSAVGLGNVVRFGAITISLFSDITFRFSFDACGFTDFGLCIIGRLGFEVIGLDGIVVNFSFCFPLGGSSISTQTDGGSLSRLEFTSAGNCTNVSQTTNPFGGGIGYVNGSSGAHYADFTRNGCCPEPVRVDLTVSTFNNQGFFEVNNFTGSADFLESESPSCGPCSVGIDALPKCVLSSETIELTARPSVTGGQYQWSLVEGSGIASIEGSSTEQSVTVRGNSVSSAANDVKVRVQYTAPNLSTCQIDRTLTVIELEPAVFRSDNGTTASSHNEAAGTGTTAGTFGFPNLGERFTVGNTNGLLNFSKNMEIGIRVAPCDANLDCNFDFKRERQGWSINYHHGQNAGIVLDEVLHCPNARCDDDASSVDEDLTVNTTTCSIYAIDGPRIGLLDASCTDTQRSLYSCFNFWEWLEFGEGQSAVTQWSAVTRLDCRDGLWKRLPSENADNMISLGHRSCGIPLTPTGGNAASVTPDEMIFEMPKDLRLTPPSDVSGMIEGLGSADIAERQAAYRAVSTGYRQGKLLEEENARLIEALLELGGQRSDGDFESSPLLAIRLLGELQIEKAVPLLVERANDPFSRVMLDVQDAIPPAAQALVQIGDASANAILDRAESATDNEWKTLSYVLSTLDPKVVEMGVYPRLTDDKGSLGQERLRAMLDGLTTSDR